MFTIKHFIWLIICFSLIIIGLIVATKKKLSIKKASLIMFCAMLFSEISKICSNFMQVPKDNFIKTLENPGYILNPRALPFHLCSLLIFVIPYITFTKNLKNRDKCISFLVPIGICGGILAMFIPTNGVDFLDIEAYQCFVYHSALVWYAFYFVFTKQVDLSFESYKRNILIILLLFIGSIYLNSILSIYGTNFMFTSRPPMDNLPILNQNNGYIPYLLTLILLGFALISIVYLPSIIKKIKK